MLPAVFFFFLYDHYCYYYHFIRHLRSLFQLYQFYFSSTVFSFSFSIRVSSDEICLIFLVLVSCEQFLIFCMAWSSFLSFFFCYLYICLFPALIALMVLSTVLPPCSLMLFSMANWAPQSIAFISRSTHPASSSFLSPSALLASGVNCTVRTIAKSENGIHIREMIMESSK